jgi:hypothetical protein
MGTWSTTDIGLVIDDFLICMEMMIISVIHPWVFSVDEYKERRQRLVNPEVR